MDQMQRSDRTAVSKSLGNWGWYLIPLFLWGLVIALVFSVEPSTVANVGFEESYLPLVSLFFLALGHTLFLLRRMVATSVLYAFGASLLLELLLWHQLRWWHVVMYLSIVLFFEYNLQREKKAKKVDASDRVDS